MVDAAVVDVNGGSGAVEPLSPEPPSGSADPPSPPEAGALDTQEAATPSTNSTPNKQRLNLVTVISKLPFILYYVAWESWVCVWRGKRVGLLWSYRGAS